MGIRWRFRFPSLVQAVGLNGQCSGFECPVVQCRGAFRRRAQELPLDTHKSRLMATDS